MCNDELPPDSELTVRVLQKKGYRVVRDEVAATFEYQNRAWLVKVYLPTEGDPSAPQFFATDSSYTAQKRAEACAVDLGWVGTPSWEVETTRGPGRGNPLITCAGKLTMQIDYTTLFTGQQ